MIYHFRRTRAVVINRYSDVLTGTASAEHRRFSIFFFSRDHVYGEVGRNELLYWYGEINFLIDGESKLPRSSDPNPKRGNDPERAGNRPLVESVCSPFLLYFSPFFFSLFFLFSFFFFFVFDCKWRPLFECRLSLSLSLSRSISLSFSLCARLCARPVETGPLSLRSRVPTSTGERSTCNLLSSILRRAFYLRYVCLSVYPGPYANYTKGLQRPPSASLKNTHVRAREPRVSRVGSADAPVRYLTGG